MLTHLRHTHSALAVTALVCIAVTAALLWVTPATGNEYTINVCQADRSNFSTQAFEDFATRGMLSPKGGVGKTTSTFLAGNLLASHLKLRTIAVDADPGLGTLGRLPADSLQAERSLVDLLRDADRVGTAAELRPYVSRLPSGLHLLGVSGDGVPTPVAEHGCLGTLVAFLSCFYEAIILDLGTGVANPLARLAIERADQVTVVTTPDSVAVHLALHALRQLEPERTTLVVNRAHPRREPVVDAIEEYTQGNVARLVTMPDDSRLALMLASGAYSLEALDGRTRLAVKRLGLAVAERLV